MTPQPQADLLTVAELRTSFFSDRGAVAAVDGVTFSIKPGTTMGLVGESGCGKSATALSIMRLVPKTAGRIVGGKILYGGRNLADLSDAEIRRVRGGKEISMIFQEPMTSLNPVFSIGAQIIETIRLHDKLNYKAARARAIEMLELVRIAEPHQRVDDYPHQLSGGMRQRAMIAMALSCHPALLIADEPTTALDVTIQAQILELIAELQGRLGMAVLLITHDLGVVAEQADEVAIMYAGRIVEKGVPDDIFAHPRHPYTEGLMNSVPGVGLERRDRLQAIPGIVPSPLEWPSGCRFRTRCPKAFDRCAQELPVLREAAPSHHVACHLA